MNRRTVIRLGAFTALAATRGFIPQASAQSKMMFKASDVHPAGYPTVVAVENIGKKLEAATNGRLGVQMFAAMQLGGEKEAIEQAQIGAIQFARVSVGALGPVIDDLNVFNLPFLFRNTAHMQKVIDGPTVRSYSTRSPAIRRPASSPSVGWMPVRAASTTPRSRSRKSPISRA